MSLFRKVQPEWVDFARAAWSHQGVIGRSGRFFVMDRSWMGAVQEVLIGEEVRDAGTGGDGRQ